MFIDIKIYISVFNSPYHFDFNGQIRLNIKSESSIEHFDPVHHYLMLVFCLKSVNSFSKILWLPGTSVISWS